MLCDCEGYIQRTLEAPLSPKGGQGKGFQCLFGGRHFSLKQRGEMLANGTANVGGYLCLTGQEEEEEEEDGWKSRGEMCKRI